MKYEIVLDPKVIEIKDENIIAPDDLQNHVGEVLMFHNGSGYIVSAVLTEIEMIIDKNAYSHIKKITYEYELDMAAYYSDDIMSRFFTYEYAYEVVCNNIVRDQEMSHILYIGKPTQEELDFRNHYLNMDKDTIKKEYKKLKKLVQNC